MVEEVVVVDETEVAAKDESSKSESADEGSASSAASAAADGPSLGTKKARRVSVGPGLQPSQKSTAAV